MTDRDRTRRLRRVVGLVAAVAGLTLGALVAGPSPAGAAQLGNCDVNGDGFDDLPVSSPNEDASGFRNSGRVSVMFGGPNGLRDSGTSIRGDEGEELGTTMVCGDFNGDGFSDLAVGWPFGCAGDMNFDNGRCDGVERAGQVLIVPGSADGPRWNRQSVVHQNSPGIKGTAQVGDVFGFSLATADFDGDGFDDLVVGAPGEDIKGVRNAGQVHLIYGSAGGLSERDLRRHQNSKGVVDNNERGDFFGESLSIGDFDADGNWDLAVGTPSEDINGHSDAGAITVLYGNTNGGLSRRTQLIHQDLTGFFGDAEDGNRLGSVLAAGNVWTDVSGAGYWDLLVGIPGEEVLVQVDDGVFVRPSEAGTVAAVRGTENGLDTNQVQTRSRNRIFLDQGQAATNDHFGAALAIADFDGDGLEDLAVGVPGDDAGKRNSGSVHLLAGQRFAPPGLSVDFIIHQDSPGMAGARNRGDRVGLTFATGDFNGDGLKDLAVGIPEENVRGRKNAGAFMVIDGHLAGLGSGANRVYKERDVGGDIEAWDNFGMFSTPASCCGLKSNPADSASVRLPASGVGPDTTELPHPGMLIRPR